MANKTTQCLIVVLCAWLAGCLAAFASSPRPQDAQELIERYRILEYEYLKMKDDGHDVVALASLGARIKQAYRQKRYVEADRLLEQAEGLLAELANGAQTVPDPIAPTQRESDSLGDLRVGVAFGHQDIYAGQLFVPRVAELGAGITSVYFIWGKLEPQKGKYNWTIYDAFLEQLDGGMVALVGLKGASPWGSTRRDIKGGSLPSDTEAYRRFVEAMVRRAKGKVKYWMRDWEASSETDIMWAGTPQEFAETQRVFYEAVKSSYPDATVVLGGHAGNTTRDGTPVNHEFYDVQFQLGKNWFDVFDVRLYEGLYTIPHRVEWFRERMEKYGIRRPIFSTEYGGPTPFQFKDAVAKIRAEYMSGGLEGDRIQALSSLWEKLLADRPQLPPQIRMFLLDSGTELEAKRDRIQARDLTMRATLALAAGVEKLWLWDLVERPHPRRGLNPVFGKLRLMDFALEKRTAAWMPARLMLTKLGTARSVARVPVEKPNIFLFEVSRSDGERLYVLWERRDLWTGEDRPPTKCEMETEFSRLKITDVFGHEEVKTSSGGRLELSVTDTPLYLEQE